MVRIAPVNLQFNPKTLWFDARELEMRPGDGVIVLTARGVEFGRVAQEVFEADEAQVKSLKSPLKPVKRVATDEDVERVAELEQKATEALPVFKELAAQTSDEMRPISVEYLFDGDRAVFYFESENRVDFRELVRTLSSRLHVRVDMRQIGVRDEARMVGGLGHCGQELCCKRLGGEFCPVSIRMAKEQDLSLNPQKISGVCGRLMCCLRYEFDAYKDFKSRAPKRNAQVETPDGPAKVVEFDVPREVVSLKIEGEKPVKVPLSDFEPPEEGSRPKAVGAEAWELASSGQSIAGMVDASLFGTAQLSGKDKLADRSAVRHVPGGRKSASGGSSAGGSKQGKGQKGRGRGGSGRGGAGGDQQAAAAPSRKPRRRRSTKVSGAEAALASQEAKQQGAHAKQDGSKQGQGSKGKRRGQHQSDRKQRSENAASVGGGKSGKKASSGKHSANPGKGGGKGKGKAEGQQQRSVRPGQKSSGLARSNGGDGAAQQKRQQRARTDDAQRSDGSSSGTHRRARRRSHKAGGPEGGASQQGADS